MRRIILVKENRQALLIWLMMAAQPALAQVVPAPRDLANSGPATSPAVAPDSTRAVLPTDSLAYVVAGVRNSSAARLLPASLTPKAMHPAGSAPTAPPPAESQPTNGPNSGKTPRFWKLELAAGTDWQSVASGAG